MRAPVLVALALAAVAVAGAGCRARGAARLEGQWKGAAVEGVAPEAIASATQFARETTLDFAGDVLTVKTPQEKQSGRFTIDSEDKTSIVLHTDKDGPASPQTFTFVDDGTMRWVVLEGKPSVIVFQKQQP